MAVDLRVSVRRGIDQLRRQIARKSSELASVRDELRKHERVYSLLGGGRARRARPGRARPGRRVRRAAPVDWNAVLRGLTNSFTISDIARSGPARRKPRVYLRQVVVRWVKQRKVKRVARGKYQKL